MALIQCKDCNNEISDSAASCPKCGAPVPRTIGANEQQCPHCMTVLNENATKCSSCGAVKGYMHHPSFGLLGKTGTIVLGIILPGITIILIPISIYSAYQLFTGPRWFARL